MPADEIEEVSIHTLAKRDLPVYTGEASLTLDDIDELINIWFDDQRIRTILLMRFEGATYREIGEVVHLANEGVRQKIVNSARHLTWIAQRIKRLYEVGILSEEIRIGVVYQDGVWTARVTLSKFMHIQRFLQMNERLRDFMLFRMTTW